MPDVRRTFATFRMAEFGFLGVRVVTCTQTPRRNGHDFKAGDLVLVDNYVAMHGRRSFTGTRKVMASLVAD